MKTIKKRRWQDFLLMGTLFTVLSVNFTVKNREVNPYIIIMFLIGVALLIIGVSIIAGKLKKSSMISRLIKNNMFIYADYDSVISERHYYWKRSKAARTVYAASFRYRNSQGHYLLFKSEWYKKQGMIPFRRGDKAKIFVDLDNPDIYIVSLDDVIHTEEQRF